MKFIIFAFLLLCTQTYADVICYVNRNCQETKSANQIVDDLIFASHSFNDLNSKILVLHGQLKMVPSSDLKLDRIEELNKIIQERFDTNKLHMHELFFLGEIGEVSLDLVSFSKFVSGIFASQYMSSEQKLARNLWGLTFIASTFATVATTVTHFNKARIDVEKL